MSCPNKNSNEWKEIVSKHGENGALQLYDFFDGNIDKINVSEEELLNNIDSQRLYNNTPYKAGVLVNTLNYLKDKTGLNYKLSYDVEGNGKFINGTVVINPIFFKPDTLFHEFLHPFIDGLKKNNPKLYAELLDEVKRDTFLIDSLKNSNSDLTDNDLLDEAIVQKMGEYASEYYSKRNDKFKSLIDRFLAWVKDILNLSNIGYNKKLTLNSKIKDIGIEFVNKTKVNIEYDISNTIDLDKQSALELLKDIFGENIVNNNGVITSNTIKESDVIYVNDELQKLGLSEIWTFTSNSEDIYYIKGYNNKNVLDSDYYSPTYKGKYQNYTKKEFNALNYRIQNNVKNLENEVKELYKIIAIEKDIVIKDVLKEHLDFVKKEIPIIVSNNTNVVEILNTAGTELNLINSTIESKDLSLNYIKIALNITQFYTNLQQYVPSSESNSQLVIDVVQKAVVLRNKLEKISLQELIKLSKLHGNEITELELTQLKSEFGRALTLSSNNSISQSVQYLESILTDAKKRRNYFVQETVKNFDTAKNKAGIKNNYDMFIDSDGNLINIVSSEWTNEVNELKKSDDKDAYSSFMRNNTVKIDVLRLDDEEYLKDLEDNYFHNRKILDIYIQKVKNNQQRYESELSAYFEMVNIKDISIEDKNKLMQKFIETHSPAEYFNALNSKNTDNEYFKQFNYKFIEQIPKFKTKGADTVWYNKGFDKILQDEKNVDFYIHTTNLIKTLLDFLPKNITKSLDETFLPQLQKTETKKLLDNGITSINAVIHDFLLKELTSENAQGLDDNLIFKDLNIPHSLLYKKVDSLDRSKDLSIIIEKLTFLASTYYFMSNVESEAVLVNNIIQNSTNAGKTFSGSADLTKSQAEYNLMASLYSKKSVDTAEEKWSFGDKVYSASDKILLLENENKLKDLEELNIVGRINKEDYIKQKESIQNKIQSIGRQASATDIANAAMKLTYKKVFFYDPLAGFANATVGVVMNFLRGTGGLDYDTASFMESTKLLFKSIQNKALKRKIHALSDKYGIVTNIINGELGMYSETAMREGKYDSMMFMRNSEEYIKNQQFIAFMLFNKIKTKNGSEISFFEAYDGSGSWKNELFDDDINKQFNGNILNNNDMIGFRKLQNKAINISRTHGNMDIDSDVLYKQNTVGKLVGMFRLSWMAETVDYRFGTGRYSRNLNRNVEGIYKSLGYLKDEKGIFKTVLFSLNQMSRMLLPFMKNTINKDTKLTLEQQAALKQTLAEANVILILSSVILMLRSMFKDDDDKWRHPAAVLLLNQTLRLQSDIKFYMSFDFIGKSQVNLIPAWSVVSDTQNALISIYKFMSDEDYKGENTVHKILKAIPGGRTINNLLVKADKVSNY